MRYIERRAALAPACLVDERSDKWRSMLREFFSRDTQWQAQNRFPADSVTIDDASLDEAAAEQFNGRCAFCERDAKPGTLRAYRLRPVGEAGPPHAAASKDIERGHLYYSWLANVWDNIYTICEACQPADPAYFPVKRRRQALPPASDILTFARSRSALWARPAAEGALLIDPCAEMRMDRHFLVLPTGELIPRNRYGAETINHFSLNREPLRRTRERRFRSYIETLAGLPDTGFDPRGPHPLDFGGLEFGGSWYLLLARMIRHLDRPWHTDNSHPSEGQVHDFYATRLGLFDRVDQFLDAFVKASFVDERAIHEWPARTGTARPIRIRIDNFKSIEHLTIDLPRPTEGTTEEPTPALLILGENAAGKSSVLEAVALALCDLATRSVLDVEPGPQRLNPALMGAEGTRRRRTQVRVELEDGTARTLFVGQHRFTMADAADAAPVFAYGAFRLFLDMRRRLTAASHVRSLFEPHFDLSNPEAWLANLHKKNSGHFAEVVRALRSILALSGQAFDVLDVDSKGAVQLVASLELADGRSVETRTPLSLVSSGFRSVLGMSCDVMRGLLGGDASLAKARATVLIDEIEAHLHPRWKMQIIRGLQEALPNVTFIATTHDPLCLRGLGKGDVLVLRRVVSEGSGFDTELPVAVLPVAALPAPDLLSIEQLLTSDFFQLFSTDAPTAEDQFARLGDLLAAEAAGRLSEAGAHSLTSVRSELSAQIARALPLGSTQVEQIVLEAVETYIAQRRQQPPAIQRALREKTRADIVNALGKI